MGIKRSTMLATPQQELLNAMTSAFGGSLGDLFEGIFGDDTEESISRKFMENFARPVMDEFRRSAIEGPGGFREAQNLPGAFYSSSRFEGEQAELERFQTSSINPLLFSSLENFRNREVQQAGIYSTLLGTASGLGTAQTIAPFYKPSRDWQAQQLDIQKSVSGYIESYQNFYKPDL
jgi:hypothetical protein